MTRTESRRLDRKNNPRIAAHRPPKETAGLRNAGVCAKGTKKESNTLDVADFVRDVEKSLITIYLKMGYYARAKPFFS